MREKRLMLSLATVVLVALFTALGAAAQDAPGSPCMSRRLALGVSQHTLEVDGLERTYTQFVPSGYTGTEYIPLVLSLHGVLSNAAQQQRYTGWNAIAERENFIVVYPEGTPLLFGYRWNAGEALNNERPAMNPARENTPVDDVAFIRALMTSYVNDFCIDPARIYVNGFSNGGGMTAHLACALSDRIAAIGTVAGAFTAIPGGCNPERPVSVIAFQGGADRIVPPEGNARMGLISAADWVAEWADRDECDPAPEAISGTSGAVTGIRYAGCAEGSEVVLYSIADGGHTWAGGDMGAGLLLGKTSRDIDASETMWAFFQAHPLE